MKKQKEEWQYFIIENEKTKEQKQFRIGPCPVKARDMMNKMKLAHEEIGVPFHDDNGWPIVKAWVGA